MQFVETQLAGAIGSASARVMVASVVEEEPLDLDDVLRILDEASQLRALFARARGEVALAASAPPPSCARANEQLKSLDRLKDDFMSSVTHELRTPLTSIRALAELMLDDPDMDAAQRQQFLGIIVAETERLSRLVNQVLDLAKIESGHAEWHNADVDLRALLTQAVQTTAELLRERGAELALHLPEQPLPPLRADPDRLHAGDAEPAVATRPSSCPSAAAASNVGLRAARRWPDGRRCTTTAPACRAAQQRVDLREVPPGRRRRATPGQGTGLGLPISRQIVEHFGGRLWLRCRRRRRCMLRLLAAVDPRAARCQPNRRRKATMSAKILIADDEPNILISLEYLMKREGFEVCVARDGDEALDAVAPRAARRWCCST